MKKTREDIAIDLVEGDRILDVGCWRGYTSETLAKRYKEVIGIDLLPKEIEKAKKRVKAKNVRFEVMDACSLKFPDNYFDCALFLEIIEHVENPIKALKEIYRVLKPGGCLVLSTPNAASYLSFGRQLFLNQRKEFKKKLSDLIKIC